MAFTINGTSGLTFPDSSTQTTRAVSRSGDTMTGPLTAPQLVISGGGAYGRGSIYSDVNWGMLLRGAQASNPSQYEFGFARGSDDTKLLLVDASGRVTMPLQPAFAAYGSAGEVTYTGTADLITAFNATKFNVGSHFNTSNCRFTAPVAGKYYFYASVWKNISNSLQASVGLFKNGAQYEETRSTTYNDGRYHKVVIASLIDLAVGDYVELKTTTFNQHAMIAADQYNKYCGWLVC